MNPDDPNAIMKPLSMLRNPSGAVGPMQVKPDSARDPGYGARSIFDVAEGLGFYPVDRSLSTADAMLQDPEISRAFALNYLQAMNDRFGGLDRAAAAYNMGPSAFGDWSGEWDALPDETQDYVAKVRQYWTHLTGQPFPMTMSRRPVARPTGGNS